MQPASSPFGQTSGGMFGASAAPAAPAAASFGATPAFGQTQPAFGAQSAQAAPAFGAQPTTAFGAQSAPAFGGSSAFGGGGAFGGGSAFGARPAFGAPSSPAFGAASTPAFGQTPGGFGAAAPAFGQGGGFGAPQQAAGTRSVQFRKTPASDSTSGKSDGNYLSIVAMPEYANKSFEELRWEDYEAGCKGNTGGTPPGSSGFGQSSGGFGTQSPQPFGTPSSGFGASTPAFGQSLPAFGASSSPAFGSTTFGGGTPAFGQSSAPAFGQSSAPAFGQTPAFGSQSTPAFGNAFGTPQSTPAFGGATSNPFGQSTPAFGSSGGFGFGTPQQSSSGFGTPAQSTPAFGSTGFTSFGQSSAAPAFGSPAPAFGQQPQQQSTPAFSFSTGGAFGNPQQSTGFGAPAPGFGAASAPSFGNLFNNNQQSQQKPGGGFGFGQSSPAGGFGTTSMPAFGMSQPSSIFGAPAQSGSAFGNPFGQSTPAFGSTGFGQPTQQQQSSLQQPQQQNQLVPIDPNNPYGQLPDAPKVPEYPVGLAAKPGLGTVFSRSSPLLAPRPISRPLSASTYGKPAAAGRPRSRSTTPALSESIPSSSDQAGPSTALVLTPRSNPRHLFVSSQLPSTGASSSFSPSPSSAPSANPEKAKAQDDQPSLSKQPGPDSDAAQDKRGEQGASRDKQPADEMQDDDENGNDAEKLTEAQISSLLPKLDDTNFVIAPSMHQLADLARAGGASELRQVQSFMVEHKTWGSVRWLEPVDVRSLALKELVRISRANVEVYPPGGPKKPDLGDGLNKPAEITLYKIFKRDKSTGQPTTDPKEQEKFARKLQETATKQNTEFVSFDKDRGIWKFRVDHFSRYGLSDSDDEDEGGSQVPMQERTQTQVQPLQQAAGVTDRAAPAKQGYGLFDEDENMDDDSGSDQTGRPAYWPLQVHCDCWTTTDFSSLH
ncbi:hypothetical protein ABBQ38_005353 [Trebouxia sp. C0009 RCD-2024]